jgi:indole-3-glycerol phosphate synthase
MKSILETIVDAKREEVELLKAQLPLEEVQEIAQPAGGGMFKSALADSNHVSIIAELKKASPSRGVLMTDFNPVTLARKYSDGGAAALSVLTEEKYFFGRYEYLELARNESGLPVLCKDFIIDRYQIYHARMMKADAILLIVALHDKETLSRFIQTAASVGLDCLVEVHDEHELDTALLAGAEIVGVNNRNLSDFSVSLETSERLAARMPDDVIRVAESGIFDSGDIRRLRNSGFSNFLIGEALVKSPDPAKLIQELRAA